MREKIRASEQKKPEREHDAAYELDDAIQAVHDLGINLFAALRLGRDLRCIVFSAHMLHTGVDLAGVHKCTAHQNIAFALLDELAFTS